jgi:hypothetical protein
MYTATSAVRVHGFDVVIPTDCVNARSEYENTYALHQVTHLPGTVTQPVTLAESEELAFGVVGQSVESY